MQTTNNNWNSCKKVRWVWWKKERKNQYKNQVKGNEKTILINLIKEMNFKWPICKICKECDAKYDMFICELCEEAMYRLKKDEMILDFEDKYRALD